MESITATASFVQPNTLSKADPSTKAGGGNSTLFAGLLEQITENLQMSEQVQDTAEIQPASASLWIPNMENAAPPQLDQALEELIAILQSLPMGLRQEVMDSQVMKDWVVKASAIFEQQPTIDPAKASKLDSIDLDGVLIPLKNLLYKLSSTSLQMTVSTGDAKLLAEELKAVNEAIKQSVDNPRGSVYDAKFDKSYGNPTASNPTVPIGAIHISTNKQPRVDHAPKSIEAITLKTRKESESKVLMNYKLEPVLLQKDAMPLSLAGIGTETASDVASADASLSNGEAGDDVLQWFKTSKTHVEGKPMEPLPQIPIKQFAEEFARFANTNLKLSTFGNMSEAKISLTPEHLGHVDIRITTGQGQIVAHFAAETIAAREMIENQLPQLRASLTQQGLQVDKITVSQTPLSGGLFHDQQKGQSFYQPQQQQNRQSTKISMDMVSGYDLFFGNEVAESNVHLNLLAGSGNKFDATA
jgi:flagellar hook-length control protein FliK